MIMEIQPVLRISRWAGGQAFEDGERGESRENNTPESEEVFGR